MNAFMKKNTLIVYVPNEEIMIQEGLDGNRRIAWRGAGIIINEREVIAEVNEGLRQRQEEWRD